MPISIIIGAIIIAGAWIYTSHQPADSAAGIKSAVKSEDVIPTKGITLPVRWSGLGSKLVAAGVIDKNKFEELYAQRGGLSAEDKVLVYDAKSQTITITPQNSNLVLNLLWALGLGNKNEILDKGPMSDKKYGGADQFASTGGWTLGTGRPMDHFSQHEFITLTTAQQELVKKVSANIYRPCCDNSVYFPDCNHGMAMLGLLELMASQNISEQEMYQVALKVNAYWFPGTYLTIADFLKSKGTNWKDVNAQDVLGPNYSSASGYQRILQQVQPKNSGSGGGSCAA